MLLKGELKMESIIINKDGEEYILAKQRTKLTVGKTLKMLRDLKGWTQEEVSKKTGIAIQNLSLIENDHILIGRKRTLQLANVFGIHPGMIMFPDYTPSKPPKVA